MEYINNIQINSIYEFDDALSINELLCKFWEKIEEVITVTNECIDILNWLKEQGLSDEVVKLLSAWKDDGTLDSIINTTLFNELNTKVGTTDITFNAEGHAINLE